MNLLASLPVWVFYVVLGITFVVMHALAFRPGQGAGPSRVVKRVLSSALLLVGVIVVDPNEPASVLLALAAAAAAGFISGRSAPALPSR